MASNKMVLNNDKTQSKGIKHSFITNQKNDSRRGGIIQDIIP